MASAYAKGARARGKRVALGDGRQILWHTHAHQIFEGNPNVAPPGSEGAADLEWVAHHVGSRPYNKRTDNSRWQWIAGTVKEPGEVFLNEAERTFARSIGRPGYVVIEPNVPAFKSVAVNKRWSPDRYEVIAAKLRNEGHDVVQLRCPPPYGPGTLLKNARAVGSPSFRHGLAALARAKLFVGPEGGLHHGAAAVGVPGVVLFGGFVSPLVTGYDEHQNLYTGEGLGCGNTRPCAHCIRCMDAITVEWVWEACQRALAKQKEIA